MKNRQWMQRLSRGIGFGRHAEPVLLLPPRPQQPIRVARALYLREAIKRHWAGTGPAAAAS